MEISRQEETSLQLTGDWSTPEAQRLSEAWFDAIGMYHNLPEWLRYMHGMSGKKFRYFLNNLVSATPDARYLEVGSWSGSTACSAMYDNACKITCIENWEHFGGPRDMFNQNVQRAINSNVDLKLIEDDFRNVDYANIGKYNIYMYDGPHSAEDQYDGIMIAQPSLDDLYVLIIDDYNQEKDVQAGTAKAFAELNQNIIAQITIKTRWDGQHPQISHENSDWHNGYLLSLISKK